MLKDGAKRILVMSQAFCSVWKFWPECSGLLKLIFYTFQMVTCTFLTFSSLAYLVTNAEDMADLTQIILHVGCVLQVLAKSSVLFHKSEQLKTLLEMVRWEFWPSNIFCENIDRQSRKNSKFLFVLFLVEYVASETFLVMFLVLPLTRNTRELPHDTWFPGDWSASPTYQFLYFLHMCLPAYDFNVIGFDSLYCGICSNCETQFRLLCYAIGYVGSGKEGELLAKLAEFSMNGNYNNNRDQNAEELWIICIKHHQKLLSVGAQLNEIFGNGHLTQLAASIMGICAACYGLTETGSGRPIAILHNVLMYLAHAAQLFTFCAVSGELSYWIWPVAKMRSLHEADGQRSSANYGKFSKKLLTRSILTRILVRLLKLALNTDVFDATLKRLVSGVLSRDNILWKWDGIQAFLEEILFVVQAELENLLLLKIAEKMRTIQVRYRWGSVAKMALSGKVRVFLRKIGIFKGHEESIADGAKFTTFMAQIAISAVNLWPENYTLPKRTWVVCMLSVGVFHLFSLLASLAVFTEDVDNFTSMISSMGPTIQSIAKGSLIFFKRKDLSDLIKVVRTEFWPSDLVDEQTERFIAKDSNQIVVNMLLEYWIAFVSRSLLVIVPILRRSRVLPIEAWYPFDHTKSPRFEIIYLIQMFMGDYFDVNVVVGFDALYSSICSNCVAQFHLLGAAVRCIGGGKEAKVVEKMLEVEGTSYETVMEEREDNAERKLLVLCIRHHQKLIYVTDELNRIFGNGHFFQLCATLIGICPTLYQISKGVNFSTLIVLLTYYIAHLCQLFILCSVSNELSYLSSCLAQATYDCQWYNKNYKDIKCCLMVMTIRAQKAISMNAFGLFELNYVSFLSGHEESIADGAKFTTFMAQIAISAVNLWPENYTALKKTWIVCMLSVGVCHSFSMMASLVVYTKNVDNFMSMISSMGASFQALAKAFVIFLRRKDLRRLIKIVRIEYWPSNFADKETEDEIAQHADQIVINMLLEYLVSHVSRSLLVVAPIFQRRRVLPIEAWFPFDYNKSPRFEMVFMMQMFMGEYFDVNCVVGFDALYSSICSSCVAQFYLLEAVVRRIGTGEEADYVEKILQIPGTTYESVFEKYEGGDERKLLVLCVGHHRKLLHVSDELNRIFGNGHLFQLCITLIGICPTLYEISKGVTFSTFVMLSMYYSAHLFQILLLCSVSNELSHLSTCLADATYDCLWYNKDYKDLKRCLMIITIRAQRAISMNAFGVFELSYALFMSRNYGRNESSAVHIAPVTRNQVIQRSAVGLTRLANGHCEYEAAVKAVCCFRSHFMKYADQGTIRNREDLDKGRLRVDSLINIWPQNYTVAKTTWVLCMLTVGVLHLMSLLAALVVNAEDVDNFMSMVSAMASSIQSFGKAILMFSRRNDISDLIKSVRTEFWPSNLVDEVAERHIAEHSNLVVTNMLLEYVTAHASRLLLVIVPFIRRSRVLPITPWYPFDHTKSPRFEILFLVQAFMADCFDVSAAVGFDALYSSLCSNCVAQFHLLGAAVRHIGSGKEAGIIRKMLEVPGTAYETVRKQHQDGNERELLVLCVGHHQKLIHISDELNRIFGNGHFFQLCATLIGICPTLYQISKSANLAQATYECQWYNKQYKDIKCCLMIITIRAQRAISMNAFGLFELSYASFLSIKMRRFRSQEGQHQSVVMMSLRENVRSFLYNLEFCKRNKILLDDSAKYIVIVAKMLISAVNIWPVDFTTSKKLCFLLMLVIGCTHQFSLIGSLIVNAEDVDIFTQILSSTIPGLQSTQFSIAASQSEWYNDKYTDIRRCLSIVIMRAQKEESMNAFGLFELNYASFITVVRFSFSLYTFLTKMAIQVLARIINLWPGDVSVSKKVFFGFMLMTAILQELSLITHLLTADMSVDTFIKSVASMTIIMQATTKGCILFYKSEQISEIIRTIWYEFWPADTLGKTLHKDIKITAKILVVIFVTQYTSAVAFLSFYLLLPILKNGRNLPHTSWFPFDVTRSPEYELIFTWQAYLTVYINEHVVCSYDTLYCSICANCTTQFRLLCAAIKFVGSGEEKKMSERLLEIPGVNYQLAVGHPDAEERRLLVICIKHHQKLIRITEELNQIFGPGHLVQFFASVLGTCTACYRITNDDVSVEDLFFLVSFYVAHVSQLLEFCALSHELSCWGILFADAAFDSFWYTKKYSDITKCLSIVIARTQKAISMNALGLFELNYSSFITIMRFTFSLYTFMNNMGK
ncbi:hypothetical protein Trydic_g3781 [Trypoxylus dichotomus]